VFLYAIVAAIFAQLGASSEMFVSSSKVLHAKRGIHAW